MNKSNQLYFILKNISLERPWLETIFQGKFIDFTLQDTPIFFLKNIQGYRDTPSLILGKDMYLQNEINIFLKKILDFFLKKSIKINLIQLGDEAAEKLFFEFYEHPAIEKIIRNYCYPYTLQEIPEKALNKIYIFPLGTFHLNQAQAQLQALPHVYKSFQERSLIWSFIGRHFYGREYELAHYKEIHPSFCKMTEDFLSSDALGPKDYQEYLKISKFVPTVCGCNPETFRFYEALEFGAIPLYIRQPDDEIHWRFIQKLFPDILEIPNFQEAAKILSSLTSYKSMEEWEEYRIYLCQRWQEIKKDPLVKFYDILMLSGR